MPATPTHVQTHLIKRPERCTRRLSDGGRQGQRLLIQMPLAVGQGVHVMQKGWGRGQAFLETRVLHF